MTSPRTFLRSAVTWRLDGQRRSRRNALVACTALAQGRRERQAAEAFLAGHAASRSRHRDVI